MKNITQKYVYLVLILTVAPCFLTLASEGLYAEEEQQAQEQQQQQREQQKQEDQQKFDRITLDLEKRKQQSKKTWTDKFSAKLQDAKNYIFNTPENRVELITPEADKIASLSKAKNLITEIQDHVNFASQEAVSAEYKALAIIKINELIAQLDDLMIDNPNFKNVAYHKTGFKGLLVMPVTNVSILPQFLRAVDSTLNEEINRTSRAMTV